MRKLTLLLLVLLIWLQYSLWLGRNGIHDYIRISNDILIYQENNAELKSINDKLRAEIDDLNNNGLEATEEHARSKLGMIRLGETFYRLVEHSNNRIELHDLPNQYCKK